MRILVHPARRRKPRFLGRSTRPLLRCDSAWHLEWREVASTQISSGVTRVLIEIRVEQYSRPLTWEYSYVKISNWNNFWFTSSFNIIINQNFNTVCLNAHIVHICKSLKQMSYFKFKYIKYNSRLHISRLDYFLRLWSWGQICHKDACLYIVLNREAPPSFAFDLSTSRKQFDSVIVLFLCLWWWGGTCNCMDDKFVWSRAMETGICCYSVHALADLLQIKYSTWDSSHVRWNISDIIGQHDWPIQTDN